MEKLTGLRIARQSLYEQIVQQMQDMILSGSLSPGDKFPPERLMAEQLGVSRTVVREAFKTLEHRGLVKVLTGDGTYVCQIGSETISESLRLILQQRRASFENLNEIRRMLEIEIVGLAATRATAEDLQNMEQTNKRMEDSLSIEDSEIDRLESYIKADMAFHDALVVACQNPLLSVLLAPFTDQLLEFRRLAATSPDAKREGLLYHKKILEKVRARDISGSQTLMREHLARAQHWLSQAPNRIPEKASEETPAHRPTGRS